MAIEYNSGTNMKYMKTELVIAVALILGIISATITYTMNNQQVDSQDVKEHIADLSSSISETTELLRQYQDGKLSSSYIKIQLEHINKNVISIFDTNTSAAISPEYLDDMRQFEELSLHVSQQIYSLTSSSEDIKVRNQLDELKKIQHDVSELKQKI